MAYNPTNWASGDVITAEKLNKVEGAISGMSDVVPDLFVKLTYYYDDDSGEDKYTLDKTLEEILAVYSHDGVVKFQWIEDDSVDGYYLLTSIEQDDNNNPVLFIAKQVMNVQIAQAAGVYADVVTVCLKSDETLEWPDPLNVTAIVFSPLHVTMENTGTGVWRLAMPARQLLSYLGMGVYAVVNYYTGSSRYYLPILCSISPEYPSIENQYTFVVDGSLIQQSKMVFKTQNLDDMPSCDTN